MALTSTKQRKELGERLQSERERLGYTQEQIASLLGVPLDQYQRYETVLELCLSENRNRENSRDIHTMRRNMLQVM